MPERAEPREFSFSEYHSSRYKLYGVFSFCAAALAFLCAVSDLREVTIICCAALGVVAVLGGWCCWVKSSRPFARLTPHGITLHDGLLLPWSSAWTSVYAIESPGPHRACLRLAGTRTRAIPLTMFEREERKAFVEAVRKWIYSSH